ncbi:MAG: response regulator [Cyanobacteria bacterium P01_F01_bin.3]
MSPNIEVLLVEDSFSDAQMVQAIVSSSDLAQPKLHHAGRFKEALSMLSQKAYDLVLLDLHLPDGEGLSLIKQLKQQVPETPVVILTGTHDDSLAAEALKEGAQDYVLKSDTFSPTRLEKIGHTDLGNWLVRRIQYAIKRAELARAMAEQQKIDNARSFLAKQELASTALHKVGAGLLSIQANLFIQAGDYEAAEPLLGSALALRKSLLGQLHPEVGISLYNLASLYDNQFRFLEAENLFKEALDVFEKTLGPKNLYTCRVRARVEMICRLNQAMELAKTEQEIQ